MVGVAPTDFDALGRQLVDKDVSVLLASIELVIQGKGFLGFGG